MNNFCIRTLGCKVNQFESFSIADSLCRLGLKETDDKCDLVIVNTCAVTHVACHQSRQVISKLSRNNPSATLLITGCYVDLYPTELQERFSNIILIPNAYKLTIPEIVKTGNFPCENLRAVYFPSNVPVFKGRARAYLKVQDGCEQFCSYCVVPFARKGYKSLDLQKAVSQAKELESIGFHEVVLTGIHLGRYGFERGQSLANLLSALIAGTNILRFRLSSIEPTEISPSILTMIRESNRICKHLHIPLQSGSATILKGMKREYLPEDFKDLVGQIRDLIPDCGIGTDVMVGFPGEDEKEFSKTLSLLKTLPITYIHAFPYSPRKGTAAYGLSHTSSPQEIRHRVKMLRELSEQKKREFISSFVGSYVEFLPERYSHEGFITGHTDNYLLGILVDQRNLPLGNRIMAKVQGSKGDILILKTA